MKRWHSLAMAMAGVMAMASTAFAEDGSHGEGGHGAILHQTTVLLFLGCMYLAGRMGAVVERAGLPSVLGELTAGILLFNVAKWSGFTAVISLRDDPLVTIFPFVGVILLLFKSGLEEQLSKMIAVGPRATVVAVIGMALPFASGFLLSKYVFFTESETVLHVFIGATLVATSVGITAKIFQDLNYGGYTKSVVLGAAVIDDVLGLVVLAVVSVMAAGGEVTAGLVGQTTAIAFAFLAGSIAVGYVCAPLIGRVLSRIHSGVGMKAGMALGFCTAFSYLAVTLGGLEPIVGAFAAGLVLEATHFRHFHPPFQTQLLKGWIDRLPSGETDLRRDMERQMHHKEHAHIESLIEGFARFFVPLFFVHTGMGVDLGVFSNVTLVGVALVIALAAIVGKLACGLASGAQSDRWVAGWAMVARGEVGLVFATLAKDKGVFDDGQFAVMVMVVVISTFVPPVLLPSLIRKGKTAS